MNLASRLIASARQGGRLFRGALYVLDAAVIAVATLVAYYARFEGNVPPTFATGIPIAIVAAGAVYLSLFTAFGLYRLVLRYVSIDTMLRISGAVLVGFPVLAAADYFLQTSEGSRTVPFGVLFIQALLVLLGVAGIRAAARVLVYVRSTQAGEGARVLIVGAGSAGSLLLREIEGRPQLGLSAVGFLDDDARLLGRTIGGVKVIGNTSALARVVVDEEIEQVLVALPSAPPDTVRRILNAAAEVGVTTRIMPSLVIAKGSVSVTDLRKVEVEDLLGREQTAIDLDRVRETILGKVVVVTGAAGSIGSELCRQIMQLSPAKLVLIEIDETRLYELWLELSQIDAELPVMAICDIRDAVKLDRVFAEHRPAVVLHAAAYKHVPLMETAPDEAVKTNVLGTSNVIEACEAHGAERFVLISTDKAVAPANVMGLTKLLAERVMLFAARRDKMLAVAVRFGNVLASRGSVVPIFENQLRHGGPLTVTDPDVTRYFMTIPEAARLVLQAQAIGKTGDIFVLEMGEPVRIVDLARKMIALSGVPADITFVGLRPGEKLHESLVHEHESLEPTGAEKILRVVEAHSPDSQVPDYDALIDAALHGRVDEMTRLVLEFDPEYATRGYHAPAQ
ncbi:MAG: nucleoside-diphosphate sugar epimerase/dehydratase [Coriobacteriia bacterium]|nr:nucleoside-diphosphate sugar epimerase/dehydratase [Coriobacteriia bacterium]